MSNLYLVLRTDSYEYDAWDSYVCCCDTEGEARRIMEFGFGWIEEEDIDTLRVSYLGKTDKPGKPRIILSSFKTG